MPNDGEPRQPGDPKEAAGATTEPGIMTPAAPADTDAALPVIAASPYSHAGTEKQRATYTLVLQILSKGGLTIEARGRDGEFREVPIGKGVVILLEQKALTEEMARYLNYLYETYVLMFGAAEQSPEHRSILEAIKRGARETLYDTSSGQQERNEDYGDFCCNINLGGGVIKVSIVEAIAWFEYEGHLAFNIANHLRVACMENMRQMPYRKALKRDLRPEEIERELLDLEQKAREITDPTNDIEEIRNLEEQLEEGDYALRVDWPDGDSKTVDFLTGIFRYKQDKKLNTGPAIRLAKKYIDELLKDKHEHDDIIRKVEWIYYAELITHDELCQLLGCIITDPDELGQRIASAADLSLDGEDEGDEEDIPPTHDEEWQAIVDGPPVPAAFVDTRGADHTTDISGVRLPDNDQGPFQPEISRLITGRRLVLAAFGLLAIAGATGVITTLSNIKRPNSANTDAAAIASTAETGGEQSKGAAPAPTLATAPTPRRRPAATITPTSTQATPTPTPATQAPAPTPAPIAPARVADTPQSITIPVTIKPSASESGFKIDITASRAQWESEGYAVSVSAGITGKIIRLTNAQGHVYEIATGGHVAADTATLQATLRPAQ